MLFILMVVVVEVVIGFVILVVFFCNCGLIVVEDVNVMKG